MLHFISDLHLCHQQPQLLKLFKHYMQEIAPTSDQLYILGDLFEVWLGDDAVNANLPDSDIYQQSIQLIRDYSDNQGDVFVMHGNRDFLLATDFAKQSGASLLPEVYILELFNKKIGLMHGDSLCTDDTDYQAFKTMVRDPIWQQDFLKLDLDKRVQIASALRQQSQQQQKQKTMTIMDVNTDAVINIMQTEQLDILIHGHTHRQKTHSLKISPKNVQRIVLSDWNQQGFYLAMDEQGFSENYFNC
ncbi:MAG: UDP-2,3-diacylglucosamine diphosphatase [Enterobacterales bacterium]|nr:UDP-2,3-diacylglucosamine diphosphatase [Enterobacterales bacterium]